MQPVTESVDVPEAGGESGRHRDGARTDDGPDDRLTLPGWVLRLAARRRFPAFALLAGYLGQVLFRLSLVLHNSYPSVHADEASYLVIARVFAGGSSTEMPVGVVIPGGYPLLLAPALRLGGNPVTAYHLVMGTNALVNALVFPLAFLALRRLGLPRLLSFLIGTAAALLPPVIFYSEFAMSDTVFPVILLCWLLTMHGWLSDGSLRRRALFGAGTGLAAGYALATHDRGGVVVALTALVLLGALVFGWAPRRATLVAVAALGVTVLGAKLMASYVESRFKDSPPSSVGTQVLDNLLNTEVLGRTLTRTTGQFWYFMTSSWGFGALALAFCLFAVFSSRVARASRVVAFVMVAALVGIALASAAGLGDGDRLDNWIYARYLAPLVPVYFLVGAAVLYRCRPKDTLRLALAGGLLAVVSAEVVMQYAGGALRTTNIIPWAMPDALFLASEWTGLHMWRTMAGAFLVLGLCVLMRVAGGRRVMWALTASLCAFALYATSTVSDNVAEKHAKDRRYEATGFTKDAGIRKGDSVVLGDDVEWGLRMAQAYEVYWGRVWTQDLKDGGTPRAGATAVLLKLPEPYATPESSWPGAPAGWEVDRVSIKHSWVLWRKR
ncbi:hypothetical protein [Kitasatospora herbaricolor]|uniref:hypothetical protein n=1 Tax=Kitasatospora herbaricolor TaxID=68217 RepID=UPI0036D82FB3